ncbi:MAG: hypothetical protein ACJ8BW_10230, partial [Ktedonobacteraceae bacterium]
DNRLQPEALTLQQRVELPIWHPDGMRGLHDDNHYRSERTIRRKRQSEEAGEDEVIADNPRPEDWLPQVMIEVCQDILQGLEALDAARAHLTIE